MLTHAETHGVAGTAPGAASQDTRELLPFTGPAMLRPRRALGMRLRRCKAQAMEAPGFFYLPAPRLMKAGRIKGVQGRVCWGGGAGKHVPGNKPTRSSEIKGDPNSCNYALEIERRGESLKPSTGILG